MMERNRTACSKKNLICLKAKMKWIKRKKRRTAQLQKRKRRSFSDKKIIEEQMEMIRMQKIAWEKQSMLYSKMMDFFLTKA
ncbi:hypothetical protein ANCCAN_11836 [Ancylostoma caninum]|uniref:Uncharacterized protein n=1 Tax=Ancylostoma caninum TaxID=29170 RepID=A0A368GEV7_ANCCA|nr:hypothetical protein ANCCAN_11836 [Ancylostoma caninum]